jgi:hypothetical protein
VEPEQPPVVDEVRIDMRSGAGMPERSYRDCYRDYRDCLDYGLCLESAGGVLEEDEDKFDYDGTEYCGDYVW